MDGDCKGRTEEEKEEEEYLGGRTERWMAQRESEREENWKTRRRKKIV